MALYTKQTWIDGAAGNTPITADRLNKIEQGVADVSSVAESAVKKTGAEVISGAKTFSDGIVVPDGSLEIVDVNALATRLTSIETAISNLQAAINNLSSTSIAAYVPVGGTPNANLPVGSIAAFEVTSDPVFVGYAPSAPVSATNFVLSLPSLNGAPLSQPGDTVVIPHVYSPNSGADYVIAPGGYNPLISSTISTDRRLEFTYKILTSADITAGTITLTYSGPQKPAGGCLVVRNCGVPTGTISKFSTSTTSLLPPPINTTKRSLLFTFIGIRMTGSPTSATTPTGYTQLLKPDGSASFVATGSTTGGETSLGAATIGASATPVVQAAGTFTPTAWTIPTVSSTAFAATIAIPAV